MKYFFIVIITLLSQITFGSYHYGMFSGEPVVKLLNEGRDIQLLTAFEYIDPSRKKWKVPKNIKIDGASIPKYLWSIIGSPLVGKYRNASIIHDYFCDVKPKIEAYKDVHKMFYNASRAGGVSEIKAKFLYFVVLIKGPRWKTDKEKIAEEKRLIRLGIIIQASSSPYSPFPQYKKNYNNETADNYMKYIQENNPSLEEIEAYSYKITF